MYYRARYYAQGLGRFISADTLVADGRKNPQQFNAYTYALNNPLRYIDPTGHLTDAQIQAFTPYNDPTKLAEFAEKYPDLYNMLRALHFGDIGYFNYGDGTLASLGYAGLNQTNGHLQFSNGHDSVDDLIAKYVTNAGTGAGWILTRLAGLNNRMFAHWSGETLKAINHDSLRDVQGSLVPSTTDSERIAGPIEGTIVPAIVSGAVGVAVGTIVGIGCGVIFLGNPACAGVGTAAGSGASVAVSVAYPVKENDRTLTYEYRGGSSGMMYEITVIRGNQIVDHSWIGTGVDYHGLGQ